MDGLSGPLNVLPAEPSEDRPHMAAGILERIWLKTAQGGPMQPVSAAFLVRGQGIRDNADFGGRRQVTILEKENWELLCAQLDRQLDPAVRRANLMVSGVPLLDTLSQVLQVGPVRIRVQGETQPCHRMDQACYGLRAKMALMWRGGVWGEVLEAGQIQVGDTVNWVP